MNVSFVKKITFYQKQNVLFGFLKNKVRKYRQSAYWK